MPTAVGKRRALQIRAEYEAGADPDALRKKFGLDSNAFWHIVHFESEGGAAERAQLRQEDWRRRAAMEIKLYGEPSEPFEPLDPAALENAPLAARSQRPAEMRADRTAGLSFKEIAAKYEVPYHTAYQAAKGVKPLIGSLASNPDEETEEDA